MHNTYCEIYIHLVWGTKNREQLLTKNIENTIYPIIESKALSHKASVIAKGNTGDHIHLLLSINPDTNIANLVKEIKGATSYFTNHKTKDNLYWQDGYGVLSVSKSGLEVVKRYVENQMNHHGVDNGIISVLEKSSIS
jgi:putative transposase